MTTSSVGPEQALRQQIEAACKGGKLSTSAAENLQRWLTEPRYAAYRDQVADEITKGRWKELDDVFWTVIPFGTGGRRGKMYPVGSNAINDVTIGESAQGLATYVRKTTSARAPLGCAIAYDTRHRSRHFAELCGEVMVANGFTVYFLDGYRSTPELSFTVRHKGCACGLMVTASHNPPSDNAVKVYWSTGGQLLPPHDKGVITEVMAASTIQRTNFAEAVATGKVVMCQEEVDRAYLQNVQAQSLSGPRELKIIYSPMHGVGGASVPQALAAAGFVDVELFAPHAQPDGDFPGVPDNVANPENPATFESMIARALESGAELILSTDPDADRLGCAARVTAGGPWKTFTGNQIGALLTEYLLAGGRHTGLGAAPYVVKTLVTSELIKRIADAYNVTTYGNLHVGFKWIGGVMDEVGPGGFILGTEESHGYLVGTYARDKDATVAALLVAELAAKCKSQGKTLHEQLDSLFWQHGCHLERTASQTMPGSQGMSRMRALMAGLRAHPPERLAGMLVRRVRDYGELVTVHADGKREALTADRADMIILDLDEGNYAAARPSGTEPKVKFYLFAYESPEHLANLEDSKRELTERLTRMQNDLTALAAAVA